jgi:hypothetical protein
VLVNQWLKPAIGRETQAGQPKEMLVLIAEYCVARLNPTLAGSFQVEGDELNQTGGRWEPNLTINYHCHSGGVVDGLAVYTGESAQNCAMSGVMFNASQSIAQGEPDLSDTAITSWRQHQTRANALKAKAYPSGAVNQQFALNCALTSLTPGLWDWQWHYVYYRGRTDPGTCAGIDCAPSLC